MPADALPESFPLLSADVAAERRELLRAAFPEVFTEGGKVDWERLRRALGDSVDAGKERYGLNWPGKAACFTNIQTPSRATLRPARGESVEFDATGHVIIEGDNLEVLKLLQKSYLGQVKMIYIDPPYNTGNDFIYPDNYAENLETYLRYTGQVDADGQKFSTNPETDGRFHSRWLNMMYPRLYLARNLLRDDGLIFISVDDGEVANLRGAMNEIFGEENFLANIAWEKRYTRSNNARLFYSLKDNIVVYRKTDIVSFLREARSEKSDASYDNPDNDPRGLWTTSSYVNPALKSERANLVYPIKNPVTGEEVNHPTHAWKYEFPEHQRHISENRLHWARGGDTKFPRLKIFLSDVQGLVPIDLWDYKSAGTTDEGGLQVKELFGEAVFDNPKPTKLIQRMLSLATTNSEEAIVMDFFGGSGTTAQAVLELNKEDGGNRRFILVQLPEPTGRKDYPTIADITKERVRRVIQKLDAAAEGQLALSADTAAAKPDRGFKVFKLDTSNFLPWDGHAATDAASLRAQLELHVHHLVAGRQPEDLLFELLLKSGYPLTAPVETLTLAGRTVFSVAWGDLLLCLERELSDDLLRAMAERQPTPARVVCLDEGFAGQDALKTNAVQTMKTRGVTKFQTV